MGMLLTMKTPISLVPQPELQALFALFNSRRYPEMEISAQKISTRYPQDGQAWKAWGIALLVQRKDAMTALRKAAELLPLDVEVKSSLAGCYSETGQYAQAAQCYRQAIQIKPLLAYLHSNLGDVLARAGDPIAAEASCRTALKIQPTLAAAHVNLGSALQGQDRLEEAAASYKQALALNPGQVEAHRKLAWAAHAQGLMTDTATHLREALKIDPEHAATHYQLGSVLLELREADQAVTSLQQAVALEPLHALAHSNLGNGLMQLGRFNEALRHHEQAALLAPGQITIQSNLGHALKASGRPANALAALQRALAIDSDRLDLYSQVLFLQQYQPDRDHDQSLVDAMHFGALARQQATLLAPPRSTWPNPRQPEKRLRVGLLSSDLRAHPVGFFIESVLVALAGLQANKVELAGYANQTRTDALTARLRSCCNIWHEVADMSDGELAACISADGIDILIDLAGHTLNNRLPVLAWRPAPVQVSWLGYCATTGLTEVDAFIADPWIAPPQVDDHFIEPILRLPHTFLCFTPPPFDWLVAPLPALNGSGVRFGGLNDLAKMNDAVVAVWSRVLQAVPHSVLVLQSASFRDTAIQQAVLARYARHGVHAHQLLLKPAQPRAEYLTGYSQIDISLDPFPYPGGTTSLESLWMGVPVLTLPGAHALSRQGLSLLSNMGLTDWIATSEDDYVQRAKSHATDLVALSALRGSLRSRLLASPLCNAAQFAQDFEAGLRGLWQKFCSRAAL